MGNPGLILLPYNLVILKGGLSWRIWPMGRGEGVEGWGLQGLGWGSVTHDGD